MLTALRSGSLVLAGTLVLGLAACDDPPPEKAERKSVIEGGKAESEAGKKVEQAKKEIEATEKLMQDQADDRFEKSGGEKVERGVP